MPTIRQVLQLIQQGYYAFLLISRMFIYIFLLLSVIVILDFVLQHKPYQWRVLPFGLATSLTKPILFLSQCKGFLIIYLDDILALTHSNHVGKRA